MYPINDIVGMMRVMKKIKTFPIAIVVAVLFDDVGADVSIGVGVGAGVGVGFAAIGGGAGVGLYLVVGVIACVCVCYGVAQRWLGKGQ